MTSTLVPLRRCVLSFVFVLLISANSYDASLDIVSGGHHNCVFEPGRADMKCWGQNAFGQLGYGDTTVRGDDAGEMSANLPIVNLAPDFIVIATSLGWAHSCATSQEHAVKCWGRGNNYQTGHATNNDLGDGAGEMGANLAFVEFRVDFVPLKVAPGYDHSCVLSTDALLVCFGSNQYGQCGAGTSENPVIGPPSNIAVVELGSNFTPIDISVFGNHVCALSQQQTMRCFGLNEFGQLGYGDREARGRTPQSMGDGLPVVNLGLNFIPKAVVVGRGHTCALSTANTLKCFGDNASGQCGQAFGGGGAIGDEADEMGDNLPIVPLGAGFVPIQMALGRDHTCILSESAQVVCFGDNTYGQLGLGHQHSTTTLTPADLGTDFVPRKISAGRYHTCAISTVDTIKCWGVNSLGELGLGNSDYTGNNSGEMGDNLPIVDVSFPTASPTTATPTSATATPTTASPTTASPTSATATPTTATASPTTATPTTAAPTNAPSRKPSASPTTRAPTTAAPSTVPPTTSAPTTAYPTTAAPSKLQSVMNATTNNVTSTSTTSAPQPPQSDISEPNSLLWLLYVVLCIVSVCLCFTVFGIFKCITAKRHHHHHRNVEELEVPVPDEPEVQMSNVRTPVVDYNSEVEEKKEDISQANAVTVQPGAGEPDFGHEDSVDNDNRAEGLLRASMVAQAVAPGGLPDYHGRETADNYSANYGAGRL